MSTRIYTGRWFLKKRLFGGYTIYVEVSEYSLNADDNTIDPSINRWKKANIYDLTALNLLGKQDAKC